MEEEDKAKKKVEEEYDFEVKRAEKKRLKEAMKRVEMSDNERMQTQNLNEQKKNLIYQPKADTI